LSILKLLRIWLLLEDLIQTNASQKIAYTFLFLLLLDLLFNVIFPPSIRRSWPTVIFTPQALAGAGFGEWISLLTLCLAPLIAHVVAGVPAPVYLHERRPAWHDRICHYNPTSVIWRYFAITDRRLRAINWTSQDLVASNAKFWTSHGWDGSETMIESSREFCIQLPATRHIELFSASTATTIVVTLQGLQAMYELSIGVLGGRDYSLTVALDSIFVPLAVLSLLRLPAALWITDDYAFISIQNHERVLMITPEDEGTTPLIDRRRPSNTMNLIDDSIGSPTHRYRPTHSFRGLALRFCVLASIFGLWTLCLCHLLPKVEKMQYTTTNLLVGLFYFVYLTAMLGTFTCYFFSKRSTTTVIPCIASRWYKIYTYTLLGMMLLVVFVSAFETRRTACGRYTTYPHSKDSLVCSTN
jgi:hypothetical protein